MNKFDFITQTAQSVSHVHSFIFNFSQPALDPQLVNRLLEGVEAPTLKDMNLLLKMYGIAPGNTEALLFEITKMVESYMQQAELALPPAYDVTWFCNQFLGVDSFPSLRDTFADLHFKGRQSFTWNAGFVNFYNEIWRAEDSPPGSVVSASNQLFLETPLDQFVIYPIIDLHVGNFYFTFTISVLYMLLTVVLVVFLFFVVTKKGGGKSVPNAWQSLVELIYDFVLNLVNEQIGGLSGNVKQKFFPRISVTFTFSLFRNPQGMIPFSFTVTSHFLITLALSFSIFIGITIVGFQRHGLHFFSFLLPAGVPLPLAPFLVLLELISYCFRALSLGIRLFANMMAGHSLVKILSGFAWTMLFLNNIFYFIGDLGPLFIVLALTGLELGVAISQAHVSTISICIYLNDATNLHQNESFHN
nr:ATPase subunit 6 [Triticum urartu]CAI5927401.1 ATPase subunit 6 [Triticum urartu]CAI5927403.1 ATPase subunit 6 [Triticum urartu]CAI5927404.1 ATPase subunit 6 [Triticum urartu]CAI5927407.1 ATPase subunit 6 [Triticum urartu]